MNKKKFISIIFPSRGRLDLVEKLMCSIENRTFDKSWIEVIVIADHDDVETSNLLRELSTKVTFDLYIINRKQNARLDLPNDYYALGLKLTSDSYFTWILGNDCEILTPNWDKNLYDGLSNTVPMIFQNIEANSLYYYLKICDSTHWNKEGERMNQVDDSCCFPIMSSNYCKDLGEFYPREIPTWGGDTCLYHLMKKSNRCSILDLMDLIRIEHYCHHNKNYEQDEMALRMKTRRDEDRLDGCDLWSVPSNIKKIMKDREKFLWKN